MSKQKKSSREPGKVRAGAHKLLNMAPKLRAESCRVCPGEYVAPVPKRGGNR